MRKVFFTLTGLFTVIALILSFGNFGTSAPVAIFFEYKNTSLFFPLFLMFGIGVFAGFFFALGLKAKKSAAAMSDDF